MKNVYVWYGAFDVTFQKTQNYQNRKRISDCQGVEIAEKGSFRAFLR